MLRICNIVVVYDDNSTDDTVKIARSFGPRVVVIPSGFRDTDKARDKNVMYNELLRYVPDGEKNENNQHWVLAIDGDEELHPSGDKLILDAIQANPDAYCVSMQVLYLWDTESQVRTDGIYAKMFRPSLFRIINSSFHFQPTGFPNNLHCPNVPQELLWKRADSGAILLHYGYLNREDRIRKYMQNILRHPRSEGEDYYRHSVLGDIPSLPATLSLKHAGPLQLEPITNYLPCQ